MGRIESLETELEPQRKSWGVLFDNCIRVKKLDATRLKQLWTGTVGWVDAHCHRMGMWIFKMAVDLEDYHVWHLKPGSRFKILFPLKDIEDREVEEGSLLAFMRLVLLMFSSSSRISLNKLVAVGVIWARLPHARFGDPAGFLQRCTGNGQRSRKEQATCAELEELLCVWSDTDLVDFDDASRYNPAWHVRLLGADVKKTTLLRA
ncbi:hypothetical protein Tco_1320938 [Tanacetum coccineum]